MITRVFRLTEASAKYIGRLPKENAILVVKSEHKVRHLFIDALEVALYQRGDTKPAFAAIGDYFKGMVSDQAFREKIDAERQVLRHYVDEGVVYRPAFETILHYKHHKTIYSEDERLFMVKAIRYVKDAYINAGDGIMDFVPTLDIVKPDVFVVNEDGGNEEKRRLCEERGIEYVVLQRTP